MKRVNWNFKIDKKLDERVEKFIIDARKRNIYLSKTQLIILSVTSYMDQNKPKED